MENADHTSKIYRYEALLQAIDFFTQRFSLEQLGYYAFDFAIEILTLYSAVLFVREGDEYVPACCRLYGENLVNIPHTVNLEKLPTHHGDILTSKFENYFSEEIIRQYQVKLMIPLLIHDYLYGFILSNGKALGELDQEDRIIASALTKLYRNSLENSSQIKELSEKTEALDQKIFNLFAINQSAKSLLSEVKLDTLYTLATDVFSEITGSQVTSFGIYDAYEDKIMVLGYRDVTTFLCLFTELELVTRRYTSQQVVLELERDLAIIQSIFKNWEEFYTLQAEYIILLVREQILGVVTLSKSIKGRPYDQATFELVESLASFTHIAISNALLVKELREQKEQAQRKFNTLNTLNQMMRTLNQCSSQEELFQLTLKALALHFGVKKAFFATRQQEEPLTYQIVHQIGWEALIPEPCFTLNSAWEGPLSGESVTGFGEEEGAIFFEQPLLKAFGSSNCVVIAPLVPPVNQLEPEQGINSFLVVLETKDSLKEEEVLLIDTITRNLSPVVYQMEQNQQILQEYRPDPAKQLIKAIETKLQERKAYNLDFYVYYQFREQHPFRDDLGLAEELEVELYMVGSYVFLLSYNLLELSDFVLLPNFDQVDFLYDFDF